MNRLPTVGAQIDLVFLAVRGTDEADERVPFGVVVGAELTVGMVEVIPRHGVWRRQAGRQGRLLGFDRDRFRVRARAGPTTSEKSAEPIE